MTTARRLFANSPSPVFYLIVRKERGCYVFIAYPIPCLSIQAERHRRFPVQAVAHLNGGTLPPGTPTDMFLLMIFRLSVAKTF